MSNEAHEKVCDVCGGTGQVSFFQGVSRFLLSTEECDACNGTGYQFNPVKETTKGQRAGKQIKRGKRKTRK
jgi:DnaJ-class molecular chaperone